jgi:MFS family permease
MNKSSPTGMTVFSVIWFGQVVSLLGSAMTWFAFTIWAWQKTGEASTLANISFFTFLPTVLLTPIAGTLVDRWNRKLVMLLSDAATALGTLAALTLLLNDNLQIWHVYVIGLVAGFFTAFQYPAYAAAVSTMLPREHYARAEAMLGIAYTLSGILAPIFAAALIGRIGVTGIMTIDLLTFLSAFATLVWARIPQPRATDIGKESRGTFWEETAFGFRYIFGRSVLLALTGIFVAANFFLAIGATLMAPLVLSQTGNTESALAAVQSTGAVGGVVGGALLMLWGGPKRRIHGVLLGGMGASLLGVFWLGVANSLLLWSAASFCFSLFEPFVESGNIAIWQSKVEADVQGRVFAARHFLVRFPFMLGILASGQLAVLGIPLVLKIAGLAGLVVFLAGYCFNNIRQVESLLPDLAHRS